MFRAGFGAAPMQYATVGNDIESGSMSYHHLQGPPQLHVQQGMQHVIGFDPNLPLLNSHGHIMQHPVLGHPPNMQPIQYPIWSGGSPPPPLPHLQSIAEDGRPQSHAELESLRREIADKDQQMQHFEETQKQRDATHSELQRQSQATAAQHAAQQSQLSSELQRLRQSEAAHGRQMKELEGVRDSANAKYGVAQGQLQEVLAKKEAHVRSHAALQAQHKAKEAEIEDCRLQHSALLANHKNSLTMFAESARHVQQLKDQNLTFKGELDEYAQRYKNLQETTKSDIAKSIETTKAAWSRFCLTQKTNFEAVIAGQKRDIEEHEKLMRQVFAELEGVREQLKQSNFTKVSLQQELATLRQMHSLTNPRHTQNEQLAGDEKLAREMQSYEKRGQQAYVENLEREMQSYAQKRQQARVVKETSIKQNLEDSGQTFTSESINTLVARWLLNTYDIDNLSPVKVSDLGHDRALEQAKQIAAKYNSDVSAVTAAQGNVRARVGRGPVVLPLRNTAVSPPSPPTESVKNYNQIRDGVFKTQYQIRLGYLQSIGESGDHKKLAEQYASDFINKWFYVNNPRPEDIKNHGLPEATRLANAKALALPWSYRSILRV